MSLCRHLYQLMSTASILSILLYPHSRYRFVYHVGLTLVHYSYLSIGSLHDEMVRAWLLSNAVDDDHSIS